MIKLNYKGNLKKDIESVNEEVNVGVSKKSIAIDFLASLGVMALSFAISKDAMATIFSTCGTLLALSALTVKEKINNLAKVNRSKDDTVKRLEDFSKYLEENDIEVSVEALREATTEVRLFSYVEDGVKKYDKMEQIHVIDRNEEIRTLVRMRESLAALVEEEKVSISLRQNVRDNGSYNIVNDSYGVFLLEQGDLSNDNLAVDACERLGVGLYFKEMEDTQVKRLVSSTTK